VRIVENDLYVGYFRVFINGFLIQYLYGLSIPLSESDVITLITIQALNKPSLQFCELITLRL